MRRIIKTVCATALCVVLLTGCSQPAAQSVSTETSTAEVEPLKIEFKEAEITKRTDTKSNIPEYTIISDSNEKYDVVWTSSDESVAKVEEGMENKSRYNQRLHSFSLLDLTNRELAIRFQIPT